MSEKADHLAVRCGADESHVAVPESAVDLQVEARFCGVTAVLSEGLHSVGRQVKVETVGSDLRSGNLGQRKEKRTKFRANTLCNSHLLLKSRAPLSASLSR